MMVSQQNSSRSQVHSDIPSGHSFHFRCYLLIGLLIFTIFYSLTITAQSVPDFKNATELKAPDFIETRTFGGFYAEEGYGLLECSNDDLFLIGDTESFGAGHHDLWVIRTDSSGNLRWNRTYGGPGYEFGCDVLERSSSQLILAGDQQLPGAAPDIWLIGIDSNGEPLWTHTYGGSQGDFAPSIVDCLGDGFAIAGTTFSYGAGEGDVWLIRTNSSGYPLWNHTYGGSAYDTPRDIVECSDGGFAIIGLTESYATEVLDADAWLIRTNSTGHLLWNITYSTTGYDWGATIIKHSEGGFALTGTSRFEDGYPARFVAWLRILDANGTEQWQQTFNDPHSYISNSVVECPNGDLVLAGAIRYAGTENWDFWTARINTTSAVIWERSFGGFYTDMGTHIIQRADESFAIIGSTKSFGAGDNDIWLALIPSDGGEFQPPASSPLLPFLILAIIIIVIVASIVSISIRRRKSTQIGNAQ